MKNLIFILILSLLTTWGCASGGKIMTEDTFSQVSIGMTTKEVINKFGRPYSIKNLGHGEIEYKYIEKVIVGRAKVLQEKHYFIIFKNGQVSSTKTEYLNRPSYEENSYEMQTSYHKE